MQLPRCNALLASLPAQDYQHIEPHLELVSLSMGQTLFRPGECITHAHFLTSAVVTNSLDLADGNSVDTAMVGSDGAVGLGAFSHPLAAHQARVRCAGFAYRLRTELLRAELQRGGSLMKAWLLATRAMLMQMGQISVCNRHHSLEQRLARWVLSLQDMTRSDSIAITHQEVADMLGVRREAVTLTAGRFSKAGLMRFARGQLHILDREGLEQTSCECYQRLRDQAPFKARLYSPHDSVHLATSRSQRPAFQGVHAHGMRMSKALRVMATSV